MRHNSPEVHTSGHRRPFMGRAVASLMLDPTAEKNEVAWSSFSDQMITNCRSGTQILLTESHSFVPHEYTFVPDEHTGIRAATAAR